MFAVYAFARAADDFADEPEFSGHRASELDRWEERLNGCYHGETPDHPVFVALADTISEFDLPITSFASLLSGFRADLEMRRYATYADLRSYTALAVEPVASLFLYLLGYREPDMHRYGAELATGLAMAGFWQGLASDVQRDRIYLPLEDLSHYGLAVDDVLQRRRSGALTELIQFQVARTRSVFVKARPLIDGVSDELAVELALMWHGGMRILDKIESFGDRVIAEQPRLSSYDKAVVVTRSVAWRGGSLARRAKRRVSK